MNAESKYFDEYWDYILQGKIPNTKEKQIVFSIIKDITGRKGIGNEFDRIDSDIQDEIVDNWIKIMYLLEDKQEIEKL